MAPSYDLAFKKTRAAPSSLPPSARPPRTARERANGPAFPPTAKGQDGEPPSFEYTHCSKEGAKNDAPSGQDVEPPSFEYTQRSKEGAKNDAPSGQDVEPPSFEYTQRSKEGAKNDAPPAGTSSRRASSTPNARKRAPRMTLQTSNDLLGRRLGKAWSGVFLGADWERACFARPLGGVS